MGMAGRKRESENIARARDVSGGRGEDRQAAVRELHKEGDGQKEKMDGTRDKNTMTTKDIKSECIIIGDYDAPNTNKIVREWSLISMVFLLSKLLELQGHSRINSLAICTFK